MNPPTQPKAGKKVRARLTKEAWTTPQLFTHPWAAIKLLRDEGAQFYFTQRVIVIKADPASVEAMVEQVAIAIYMGDAVYVGASQPATWKQWPYQDSFRAKARAVLRSLSIQAKGEK